MMIHNQQGLRIWIDCATSKSIRQLAGLFAMADRSVSEPPKIYEHITMPIVQSGSNGNSPDMTVQKYY